MPGHTAIVGITPACAGSTGKQKRKVHGKKDHPRLRGEYWHQSQNNFSLSGSPPLARGVHLKTTFLQLSYRITPACAGSTKKMYESHQRTQDHPRLRGEYLSAVVAFEPVTGSPPLARGVHTIHQHPHMFYRITPACAGSTQAENLLTIGL